MTDAATVLGKVDVLGATVLNAAATSLLPKSFNAAGFHLVADGLVDDPDTHIEDSNSIMAKLLNTLQFPNNNYFTVQFVMQIIKKHITICGIMFQVFYKTNGMPIYCLHKMASVQFMGANIAGNVKVDTADAVSLIT